MKRREFDHHLRVAVVGAGLSGLACAAELAVAGHHVRVFEKARGPGGRMATRRAGERRFDHGAQYFTVRDPRFARSAEAWRKLGLLARWQGRIVVLGEGGPRARDEKTERFVGVPGMSAICAHLAKGLDVAFETRVEACERRENRWRLVSAEGLDLGTFDGVVSSAPAPQAAEFLAPVSPRLAVLAAGVEMAPCWAVMACFESELGLPFEGAFVHGSPLSWVARNSSKPGRPADESWVLHASPEWSVKHLELDRQEVAGRLLEAFEIATGCAVGTPVDLIAHRWRFALPLEPLPEPFIFDEDLRVGACGDWCAGPRVEGAFLSGSALAKRLLSI